MPKNQGGRPRAKRRPPSKLRAWMRRNKVTAEGLAKSLGISRSSVYALLDRTLKPGLERGVRIEKLTEIPVAYWTRGKR